MERARPDASRPARRLVASLAVVVCLLATTPPTDGRAAPVDPAAAPDHGRSAVGTVTAPLPGPSADGGPTDERRVVWPDGALLAPVDGPVVRRFHVVSRYGPGHRGVDLAARPGTPVRAPAAGVVTWAGAVAGRRWVTVDHGWVRTTVGPLASIRVPRGRAVGAGDVVGTSATAHGLDAVHVSARIGQRYVDPLSLVRPVVSLLPLTGTVAPVPRPGRTVPGGTWR